MGTSQSHSLKTTPQWSSAKKAMTSVINNPDNARKRAKLMSAFAAAISDAMYRGDNNRGGSSFGYAGSKALGNVIQFISDVKSSGISSAINSFGLSTETIPQTPRELIHVLCGITAEKFDSFQDDEAAVTAQNRLLAHIFSECDTLEDVEQVIQSADEDTIDAWIIEFEVDYIVEFMGELFQSHIFDKSANPDSVCNEIKQWLRSELNNRLADEMRHINMFSEEGRMYLEALTQKILDIWQQ